MSTYKSPFPAGFLGADLFYDGAWQPVNTDVDQAGMRVSHGVTSEGSSPEVSSLGFTLANPAGKYSPRNPRSALFGKITRNTPARGTAALGAPWLGIDLNGRATTPSVTALNIVGDIDIRWWGHRDAWAATGDLVSKWSATGNQRSHLFRAEADGTLTLFWTTDGVTVKEARSVVRVPDWAGEIALRVTLDVNNGAGGWTVQFYWSTDLASSWNLLGPPATGTGVTSIFASTAPLTLGKEPTSVAGGPVQRIHGWQLREGIGGTIRSGRTTSDLTPGVTSFLDSQSRTWTVTGGSVTNRHVLAAAEVAEWPMDWNTKGAQSVLTAVEAAGVTRRLGQGAQNIDSAIYRSIMSVENTELRAYWPVEEGGEATAFLPAFRGRPASWVGSPRPGSYEGFGGSAPIANLTGTDVRFRVGRYTGTGQVQVRFLYNVPAAGVATHTVCAIGLHGASLATVSVLYGTGGTLRILGVDPDGVSLFDSGSIAFAVDGKNLRVSIQLTQSGSAVSWRLTTVDAAAAGVSFSGSSASTTVGPCKDVWINPSRLAADVAVGHVTVESATSSPYDILPLVLNGYTGESAQARLVRLMSENNVSYVPRGRNAVAVPMGPQRVGTFLDLVRAASAADGGVLTDGRFELSMRQRALTSMGSQPPVTIPYTDNLVIPFRPTDDDTLTRNRVTVETPMGARATSELSTGPMSTLPPPVGVGLYEDRLDLNVSSTDMVKRHADWGLHVGTWDEGRYPELGVDLAHPFFLANPVLTRSLLRLMVGDRLVITDPPVWLPPRSVDVLVLGIKMDVTSHHFRIRWACVPARPYRVGYFNAGHRWSAAGTVLASGVSASATTLPLTVPGLATWTHADGDYQITVGGELMTVTNVVGNTMTVTRSVNQVVKAHLAGAAVELADPSFYAR